MQVRKFVFENQGLIKRMYGNHKHYAILKEELLESVQDGGHQHRPHEMYVPDTSPTTVPTPTTKPRESIRSNAFKETGRQLQDTKSSSSAKDGEESSHRQQNARYLDVRRSPGLGKRDPNIQHNGRRSISSASTAIDKQKTTTFEEGKGVKSSKEEKQEPVLKGNNVRITNSYSTLVSSDTPLPPPQVSTEATTTGHPTSRLKQTFNGEYDG